MKFKLSIFFIFISLVLTSQNTVSIDYSELELSNAFIDIEKKFNIKLSFNSNLTDYKFITLKLDNGSLEEILLAFEEELNINFKKITGRYYIITEKVKIDLSKTQHLKEIFIKENLTLGVKKNTDDSSISISPNNLGIIPGLTEPDVLQSTQLLPGVQSPTETASGLYIRGGTPDQNLILWDGIKMYHSGHFFGTISAFNPYITDKIKLYKNGTKARYGDRISGVVDITSDSDIPLNTKGGFGFNMTHADAYLKSPIGKHTAILVSARRSINDAFNTRTFKNLSKRVFQNTKISEGNKVFEDDEVIITNDLFYFTDLTFKAIVKPNLKDEIQFSNLFTKNKLNYGFLIEEFGEASKDKLDINNQGSSINWKHAYSEKFSQTINAYYSKYDLKYVGSNSIADEFSDQLNKQNKINDFGLSVSSNLKLKEKTVIGFGYQYSADKVKYTLRFIDSESPEENFNESNLEKNNTHAFYTDYQYKIENKLNINAGIRGNYFS
ncbi:MAG: TonB-dependent receptor, partial [Bacteroidia bacterium]|nr:TonB-dependent receptor [Bacteroidia bacterium]